MLASEALRQFWQVREIEKPPTTRWLCQNNCIIISYVSIYDLVCANWKQVCVWWLFNLNINCKCNIILTTRKWCIWFRKWLNSWTECTIRIMNRVKFTMKVNNRCHSPCHKHQIRISPTSRQFPDNSGAVVHNSLWEEIKKHTHGESLQILSSIDP